METHLTELSLEACLERHRGSGDDSALVLVAAIDSTNQLARRLARACLDEGSSPPRSIVIARHQTAGRGRRGRRWLSPAGQGIYTSLLLAAADAEALAALPLRVPLALCEALDGLGVRCGIKWPNDLVVGGRKLGGVLIEALAGPPAVIVGYGINGSQHEADLPAADATSLRLAAGRPLDLSRLAVDLALAVLDRLAGEEPLAALVDAYRRRSVHRPGDRLSCRLGSEQVAGRFAGFDASGRLELDTGDGVRVLASAELVGEEAAGGDRPGGR